MIKYHKQLYKEYDALIDHLIVGRFVALMIFFLIDGVITSYKENK
ncbi:hypothetical protein [Clostridium beijerinckii]|nr:hypothetical protein [Clostridium beijerinckii]NRT06819.1 hypothetical protein [Clostridium beijerinckii]NRU09051.1 hypothetical protein [Clostridium beijerinckii]NRU75060.1 hypothetical protein [Clostridium beijerinckii]NRU81594.1 hypothetical protein [Clostridium beijerinckii]NRV15220.1 hypothetical protein [Clostridium beijerinckii]